MKTSVLTHLKLGLENLATAESGQALLAGTSALSSAAATSTRVDALVRQATRRPTRLGRAPTPAPNDCSGLSQAQADDAVENLLQWSSRETEAGSVGRVQSALAASVLDSVAERLANEHYTHLHTFKSKAHAAMYQRRPISPDSPAVDATPRGGSSSRHNARRRAQFGAERAPTALETKRELLASRGTARAPRAEGVRSFMAHSPFFSIVARLERELDRLHERRSDSEARENRARYSAECKRRTATRYIERQVTHLLQTLFRRWRRTVRSGRHRRAVWTSFFTPHTTRRDIVAEWRAAAIERRVLNAENFAARTQHHCDVLEEKMEGAAMDLEAERDEVSRLESEKAQLETRLKAAIRKAEQQEVEATIAVAQSSARSLLHGGTFVLDAAQRLLDEVEAAVDTRKLAAVFWIEREREANADHDLAEDKRVALASQAGKVARLAQLAERERAEKALEKERAAEQKKAAKAARASAARACDAATAAAAERAAAGSGAAEVPPLTAFERDALARAAAGVDDAFDERVAVLKRTWRAESEAETLESILTTAHTEAEVLADAVAQDARAHPEDERVALRAIHDLAADDLLLRWIAHALRRTIFRGAAVRRHCDNLKADLRDGCIYVALLKHILRTYSGAPKGSTARAKLTRPAAAAGRAELRERADALEANHRRNIRAHVEQSAGGAGGRHSGGSDAALPGHRRDSSMLQHAARIQRQLDRGKETRLGRRKSGSGSAGGSKEDDSGGLALTVQAIDRELNPKRRVEFVLDAAAELRPSAAAFITAVHMQSAASSFPNAAFLARLMLTHHCLELRRRPDVVAVRRELNDAAAEWRDAASLLEALAGYSRWGVTEDEEGGVRALGGPVAFAGSARGVTPREGVSTPHDEGGSPRSGTPRETRSGRISPDQSAFSIAHQATAGACRSSTSMHKPLWLAHDNEADFEKKLARVEKAAVALADAAKRVVALLPDAARGRAHWRGVELKMKQFLWRVFDVRLRQRDEAPHGVDIDPIEDHAEWRCMDRRFEEKFAQVRSIAQPQRCISSVPLWLSPRSSHSRLYLHLSLSHSPSLALSSSLSLTLSLSLSLPLSLSLTASSSHKLTRSASECS